MTYTWAEAVGNLGMLLVLNAYLGLQLGRLFIQGPTYSACNAIGSVLLLVSLAVNFNLSSVIMLWLAISLIGLWRYGRHRQSNSSSR